MLNMFKLKQHSNIVYTCKNFQAKKILFFFRDAPMEYKYYSMAIAKKAVEIQCNFNRSTQPFSK